MSEFEEDDNKVITIRPRNNRRNNQSSRQDKAYGGWVKTKPSKQDQLNPEQIKEKLFDYERISSDKYESMDTGTFIRYIRYDKNNRPRLRLGGYLIKNAAPDYWILKAGSKGRRPITWSVPLKGNTEKGIPANEYYVKKGILNNKDERMRYGLEVYEALKSGRYMLVPTDTLEMLTGQILPGRAEPKRKKRSRYELEDHENDEETDDRERQHIKVRFQDESSSEDWS